MPIRNFDKSWVNYEKTSEILIPLFLTLLQKGLVFEGYNSIQYSIKGKKRLFAKIRIKQNGV